MTQTQTQAVYPVPLHDPDLYLPNNGQTKFNPRPVDVDHLYRDPDTDLPVHLIATRLPASHNPRDTHWRLAWSVGTNTLGHPVERQIHLVPSYSSPSYSSSTSIPPGPFLTNWGALTRSNTGAADRERHSKSVTLTVMSLAERRRLEAIAAATPVRKPDGAWNSQDWLVTVIEACVQHGLVTRQQFSAAIEEISSV
ncbi:hypothetical protein H0H87_007675 [Tephrocybe sp. NHM501043]|nr:hypothetical protein H0H87_007675 [Tephrocybe sp. NHM501043]